MVGKKVSTINFFLEVSINFNMFSLVMFYKIMCNADVALLSQYDSIGSFVLMLNSFRMIFN